MNPIFEYISLDPESSYWKYSETVRIDILEHRSISCHFSFSIPLQSHITRHSSPGYMGLLGVFGEAPCLLDYC
jgi:hypothetical protein